MKRILLPLGGAVLATGLLAAGLAGSAQAAGDVATDPLAKNAAEVGEVLKFWTASNNAALKSATAFKYDYKDVAKLVSKGGYSSDTKPGIVAPIGEEKKTAAKVHNVNLPKTIGKVFFVDAKGELKWCSGTSIQAKYRNLVSTAGHCVYDPSGYGDPDVLDKWIFVPGYYQGKTPWGIYVGKQAYTHYDFDVYEDYDRDYAFVQVYNGFYAAPKVSQVNKAEYDAATGDKWVEKKFFDVTDPKQAAEWTEGRSKFGENGPFQKESVTSNPETIGKPASVTTPEQALKYYNTVGGIDGIKLTAVEVTKNTFDAAAKGSLENNAQFNAPSDEAPVSISKEQYDKLSAEKVAGNYLGELTTKVVNGQAVDWFKQQFYIKRWTKSTTKELFWVETYFVGEYALKDVGRLGDNVGGQGFAYNQPTGKYVRTFGYPYAEHPDGDRPYTGVTPKWCYGKTSAKLAGSAAKKIEEHIAFKCAVTPGYDGGPWLLKYSNAKRLGYVNGVTSTFNDQDGNDRVDTISSPYFDGETAAVYAAAASRWSGKILPTIG